MKSLSVARRYARALYQLSESRKETADVQMGLSNLGHALETTPEMVRYLANPLVKPDDKQSLVTKVTSNKLILRFVYLLARRRRTDLLPSIRDSFQALSDRANGLHRILVRTPQPLSDAQRREVEVDLAKSLGGKVNGQFEVAKELLGGIWIKMGDKVLDATVRGRMDDLKHTLINSSN
jgi:F-type H+-transporting ATPase subunit delta